MTLSSELSAQVPDVPAPTRFTVLPVSSGIFELTVMNFAVLVLPVSWKFVLSPQQSSNPLIWIAQL